MPKTSTRQDLAPLLHKMDAASFPHIETRLVDEEADETDPEEPADDAQELSPLQKGVQKAYTKDNGEKPDKTWYGGNHTETVNGQERQVYRNNDGLEYTYDANGRAWLAESCLEDVNDAQGTDLANLSVVGYYANKFNNPLYESVVSGFDPMASFKFDVGTAVRRHFQGLLEQTNQWFAGAAVNLSQTKNPSLGFLAVAYHIEKNVPLREGMNVITFKTRNKKLTGVNRLVVVAFKRRNRKTRFLPHLL